MSTLSMLSYLINNGWKMISQNYVILEGQSRPMDVISAYVSQRHRERVAAYEAARAATTATDADAAW